MKLADRGREFLLHLTVTHAAPHGLPSGVAGAEGEVRPVCLVWTTGLVNGRYAIALVDVELRKASLVWKFCSRSPSRYALYFTALLEG